MNILFPATLAASGPLLLTGAGGWFGLTALQVFEKTYGPEILRKRVIAFASRARKINFGSDYGTIQALNLEELTHITNPAGLLHLAFLTRDRVKDVGLETYVSVNRGITGQVEKLLQSNPCLPIVTTSSGAAAALDGEEPDLEGNPYATLKQEEEDLFHRESIRRMAIVFRVYAASGMNMQGAERFALGDFLLKAIGRQQLVIKSSCKVERSYVHVGTLMELAWQLLVKPDPTGFHIIDACTDHIDLLDLARLISTREGLPEPKHEIDASLPTDFYGGDQQKFLEKLRSRGIAALSLIDQIDNTKKGLGFIREKSRLIP